MMKKHCLWFGSLVPWAYAFPRGDVHPFRRCVTISKPWCIQTGAIGSFPDGSKMENVALSIMFGATCTALGIKGTVTPNEKRTTVRDHYSGKSRLCGHLPRSLQITLLIQTQFTAYRNGYCSEGSQVRSIIALLHLNGALCHKYNKRLYFTLICNTSQGWLVTMLVTKHSLASANVQYYTNLHLYTWKNTLNFIG